MSGDSPEAEEVVVEVEDLPVSGSAVRRDSLELLSSESLSGSPSPVSGRPSTRLSPSLSSSASPGLRAMPRLKPSSSQQQKERERMAVLTRASMPVVSDSIDLELATDLPQLEAQSTTLIIESPKTSSSEPRSTTLFSESPHEMLARAARIKQKAEESRRKIASISSSISISRRERSGSNGSQLSVEDDNLDDDSFVSAPPLFQRGAAILGRQPMAGDRSVSGDVHLHATGDLADLLREHGEGLRLAGIDAKTGHLRKQSLGRLKVAHTRRQSMAAVESVVGATTDARHLRRRTMAVLNLPGESVKIRSARDLQKKLLIGRRLGADDPSHFLPERDAKEFLRAKLHADYPAIASKLLDDYAPHSCFTHQPTHAYTERILHKMQLAYTHKALSEADFRKRVHTFIPQIRRGLKMIIHESKSKKAAWRKTQLKEIMFDTEVFEASLRYAKRKKGSVKIVADKGVSAVDSLLAAGGGFHGAVQHSSDSDLEDLDLDNRLGDGASMHEKMNTAVRAEFLQNAWDETDAAAADGFDVDDFDEDADGAYVGDEYDSDDEITILSSPSGSGDEWADEFDLIVASGRKSRSVSPMEKSLDGAAEEVHVMDAHAGAHAGDGHVDEDFPLEEDVSLEQEKELLYYLNPANDALIAEQLISSIDTNTWVAAEMIPKFLWLGDDFDAVNFDKLYSLKITYLLNCAAEDCGSDLLQQWQSWWFENVFAPSQLNQRQQAMADCLQRNLRTEMQARMKRKLRIFDRELNAWRKSRVAVVSLLEERYKKASDTLEGEKYPKCRGKDAKDQRGPLFMEYLEAEVWPHLHEWLLKAQSLSETHDRGKRRPTSKSGRLTSSGKSTLSVTELGPEMIGYHLDLAGDELFACVHASRMNQLQQIVAKYSRTDATCLTPLAEFKRQYKVTHRDNTRHWILEAHFARVSELHRRYLEHLKAEVNRGKRELEWFKSRFALECERKDLLRQMIVASLERMRCVALEETMSYMHKTMFDREVIIRKYCPFRVHNIYARNWKHYPIIGFHLKEAVEFITEAHAANCRVLVFDTQQCHSVEEIHPEFGIIFSAKMKEESEKLKDDTKKKLQTMGPYLAKYNPQFGHLWPNAVCGLGYMCDFLANGKRDSKSHSTWVRRLAVRTPLAQPSSAYDSDCYSGDELMYSEIMRTQDKQETEQTRASDRLENIEVDEKVQKVRRASVTLGMPKAFRLEMEQQLDVSSATVSTTTAGSSMLSRLKSAEESYVSAGDAALLPSVELSSMKGAKEFSKLKSEEIMAMKSRASIGSLSSLGSGSALLRQDLYQFSDEDADDDGDDSGEEKYPQKSDNSSGDEERDVVATELRAAPSPSSSSSDWMRGRHTQARASYSRPHSMTHKELREVKSQVRDELEMEDFNSAPHFAEPVFSAEYGDGGDDLAADGGGDMLDLDGGGGGKKKKKKKAGIDEEHDVLGIYAISKMVERAVTLFSELQKMKKEVRNTEQGSKEYLELVNKSQLKQVALDELVHEIYKKQVDAYYNMRRPHLEWKHKMTMKPDFELEGHRRMWYPSLDRAAALLLGYLLTVASTKVPATFSEMLRKRPNLLLNKGFRRQLVYFYDEWNLCEGQKFGRLHGTKEPL